MWMAQFLNNASFLFTTSFRCKGKTASILNYPFHTKMVFTEINECSFCPCPQTTQVAEWFGDEPMILRDFRCHLSLPEKPLVFCNIQQKKGFIITTVSESIKHTLVGLSTENMEV